MVFNYVNLLVKWNLPIQIFRRNKPKNSRVSGLMYPKLWNVLFSQHIFQQRF